MKNSALKIWHALKVLAEIPDGPSRAPEDVNRGNVVTYFGIIRKN
jgi:hypothetical protein